MEERKMRDSLVKKIESKISEIKRDTTRNFAKRQLELFVNTNASTRALEDFLEDVTFVAKYR
jgi:hypothetical protein